MKLKHLNKIIDESTFYKGRLGFFTHDDEITILKNPSVRRLQGLLNQGDVRGIYTWFEEIPEMFFWNARLLNHYGFYQRFDVDEGIDFILKKDKICFADWMIHPEENGITKKERLEEIQDDILTITENPKIKSLYPNGFKIGVSY